MCITFLHHLPSALLLEQLCIFSKLRPSWRLYRTFMNMSWPLNKSSESLSPTQKKCLPTFCSLSFPIIQILLLYTSIWSDKASYFNLPEKQKKSLTGELSMLQRWFIGNSGICCLFKTMCKKISKSVHKRINQTSSSFQSDQLFFL